MRFPGARSCGRQDWLRLALVLLAVMVAAPAAGDDARISRFLQAFDETALWHDGKTLVQTKKWTGAIRLQIVGNSGDSFERFAVESVEEAAKLAGIRVERATGSDANFVVKFEDTANYHIGGRAAGCYSATRWNPRGEIIHGELFINYSMRNQLRECIVHETMHAFGFPGHPHGLDSVLSYVYRRDRLTELDIAAFRVLYDQRMRTGLYYLPALQLARQIIAEQTGTIAKGGDASGFAKAYLERAVKYLREAAEANQIMAQRQLGIALYFAQIVARDDAEAVTWWRKAIAQGDWESSYLLGEATAAGRGTPKDPAAAYKLHRDAADRGHAGAMLRVAQALETGSGVAADPVLAASFYILAAQRGQQAAAATRDALFAKVGNDGRARAEQLAKDWKPVR
ncbi:MAG: DUF2927 domain-containing protein [Alphaproteobacteria bacterium]|nr:DUF2927 domain-containing protein [Alphaproteobacteria bacterium]